ncbi:MAG: hypothetical protein K1000chlam2_00448 [Chlamydiae bacterium]|nr:hypothetical protein [Chlamydiota bacterium]
MIKTLSPEILPHLFVGAAIEATRIMHENPNNIKKVIAVIDSPFNLGIESKVDSVMRLRLTDCKWLSLSENFEEAFDFIDEALEKKSNILVHCSVGENRSVALVIAYIMCRHQKSFEEVHDLMKRKYDKTNLSPDFVEGLRAYENQ